MKILKLILIIIGALLLLLIVTGFFFLKSKHPQLEGTLKLDGLKDKVEVYFDEYGIPHIYGQNEADTYMALGYVHAQDRLWQMELMRRLGNGELAAILGPELVQTDRFFRTMGIREYSRKAAEAFHKKHPQDPMKRAVLAYYKGVNAYMEEGATPVEFHLLGVEKRPFTIADCYAIYGYMAFSFAQAFRTDPLIMRMHQNLGGTYLDDLDIHWNPASQKIPVYRPVNNSGLMSEASGVDEWLESLPVPPFIGSNAWVIGPARTKSGKVIFSNDTHIGFSQPAVWYEAHLEYPEFEHYGYYLAGIPLAVMGHNSFAAMGLTMLENDDIDFYIEKLNPDNPDQVWFKDRWEDMELREEIIEINGRNDLVFQVKTTRHGPVVNEALENVALTTDQPVSAYWIYTQFLPKNLEASYGFIHARSMEEARHYAAMVHSPGLNGMYGDADGNIAWWAMGKLLQRPDHINSKLFLDGSSGKDEMLGYFDFSYNPQAENPPSGYVYSANNQPDTIGGILHPGYYIPEDRAKRIVELLNSDEKWDLELAKKMINDTRSAVMPAVAKEIVRTLSGLQSSSTPNETEAFRLLAQWQGDYTLQAVEPTIFTRVLYRTLQKAMEDELGEADFKLFLQTMVMRRSIPFLLKNDGSVWWDDIATEKKESRTAILQAAFRRAITDLENQLGKDLNGWQWHKVHSIEHPHLLGRNEQLRPYFNVGPFPVGGGTEVINNMAFLMNESGEYKVKSGPAKRRIIDFSDPDHSVSVLPTGQSGNPFSPHYSDQAQLFVEGRFRLQKMDPAAIKIEGSRLLMMQPR